MLVKISDIIIKPGRRDIQPRNVDELARSLQAVGLLRAYPEIIIYAQE